jgi:N,N'-diacetyllegionaminate synthase
MIKIGNKFIDKKNSAFIIAEVGINHNGELGKAFEMIRVAKDSGADAVKFQTFKAEEFVGDKNITFSYQSQGLPVTESMYEMFKRYEFKREEWFLIKEECDKVGILFMSSPQNQSDLNLLLEIGVPAIKVGSDDFTNTPLIKGYAKTGLPIILSCGMANMGEVYISLESVGAFNNYPVILLLCTSQYPTPAQDANLLRLKTLASAFPDLILGFSDHTQGSTAAVAAVALGAVVFEKHFTLNKNLPGPDHWFAEDPKSLKKWVDNIRTAELMMGSYLIKPTRVEEQNKIEFRRVIVASKNIEKGEAFSEDNLSMFRMPPGQGLPPSFLYFLIGQSASKKYIKGEAIIL